MNPQYMQQQQRPAYGPPPSNAQYGEPNANLPPKGTQELQSFPQQKGLQGPTPTSNAPPISAPPYYVNDIKRQNVDARAGPPLSQPNQNNLIDQMSSMALSNSQRPPSSQSYHSQIEKNSTVGPPPSNINGISNQNHYPNQGEHGMNNLPMEKQIQPPQKPLSQQQMSPIANASSNHSAYEPAAGLQFSGQQQVGQGPVYGKLPEFLGNNAPRSTPQPTSIPSNDPYIQAQGQNRYSQSTSNQSGHTDLSSQNKSPLMSLNVTPNVNQQQQYGGSSLSSPPQQPPLSRPPLASPIPSTINQQNVSGPPSLGSVPPMPNRQNFSGPPLPGQNLHSPPSSMNQPGLSRSPVPPQSLSGPPLPGQQLSNPYGHQNLSGPTPMAGQQNLNTTQYRYSQSPSHPGVHSAAAACNQQYDHHPGYQQQHYGQSNMYANQTNPYGVSSPTSPYPSTQTQQARRLDPEQMPSPIQVIQDDQKTKGGVFTTNQKGLVPPLVTTKFFVEDQGNASPRFIRSSIYTVPISHDMIKQTQIPFALILSPMAQIEEEEYEPPIVDMGELGPVRCNRCKAYMSPFMQFVDAGRRFQCTLCKATTEVPPEYFQHLDHAGQRMDRNQRPELSLGTYEYIATKEYCRNSTFPKPPAIIFVIDVSYNTIKSGLVNLLCAQMKKIIRNLPVDVGQTKSNMKVGFITYSSTVQFYNLKPSLAQPQMMIVGDVHDVFMPLLDGFLCDPEESEAHIDSLMAQIPIMFGDTRETETILAPAIQAGLEALKASDCTGKLMVFHSSLPTAEAPGKLKNRDDRKLLGTDKEKTVLAPQNSFYNHLGQDCVGSGCSVDMFVFNNSYIDIATIGQVCRLTGGELYKYTYFQADIDGERLLTDIINNLSRPVAFDAVMRVRTSTGVRPTDFFGHLYMSNTTDIELASIDCDKAIGVEIKHDDKLSEDEGVYIQAALLYTSCSGVRRLRIINLSLRVSSQMGEIFRACDLDAIINFLSKQCVFKMTDSTPKAIKESLNGRCAAILAAYRKQCASPSSASQLILPECLKCLPLYINGLLKSDALTGGSGITIDQKSYVMMSVATMPISESLVHVYPRLLPLHEVDPQDTELPTMLRCSIDKFLDDGAYLLENGVHMFLWLGSSLSPKWLQSVFGVPSVIQVDTDKSSLPILDNPLNKRIREIITFVQSERRYCMRLTITRQRDKMEMVMRQFLIEDRGADGSPSYVDFLCHMHREIRTLLS